MIGMKMVRRRFTFTSLLNEKRAFRGPSRARCRRSAVALPYGKRVQVAQPPSTVLNDLHSRGRLCYKLNRFLVFPAINNMSVVDDYLRVCEEAVRVGGRVIQGWVGRFEVREKGPADLVTQADLASQEAIRHTVLGAFPQHSLLGEEKTPGEAATPRRRIPLDCRSPGRHNKLRARRASLQRFAGLGTQRRAVGRRGLRSDARRMLHGRGGPGAHLNGRPIRASRVSTLSDALAVCSFPPSVQRHSPDLLLFLEMVGRTQGVRHTRLVGP